MAVYGSKEGEMGKKTTTLVSSAAKEAYAVLQEEGGPGVLNKFLASSAVTLWTGLIAIVVRSAEYHISPADDCINSTLSNDIPGWMRSSPLSLEIGLPRLISRDRLSTQVGR